MSVETIFEKIRLLPEEDRIRLIHMISATLLEPKEHSLLDFRGIAAHLADDEDPQAYISRLRDEWDDHE